MKINKTKVRELIYFLMFCGLMGMSGIIGGVIGFILVAATVFYIC